VRIQIAVLLLVGVFASCNCGPRDGAPVDNSAADSGQGTVTADASTEQDSGFMPINDAGVPTSDSGMADADSGMPTSDSGVQDGGEADAGDMDAGEPDAGEPDAGEPDAGDAGPDAGDEDGGDLDGGAVDAGVLDGGAADAGCVIGEASSFATDGDLDLFGQIVYFAKGESLPPGQYQVSYVDGCMKYNAAQGWAVHAFAPGSNFNWWLVGETSSDRVVAPPGTIGFRVGAGGFEDFEACVMANRALDPITFDFAGGRLGVWLQDSPYQDNVTGLNNRNPKWKLSRLSGCVIPE
jgi:hypothetical protein